MTRTLFLLLTAISLITPGVLAESISVNPATDTLIMIFDDYENNEKARQTVSAVYTKLRNGVLRKYRLEFYSSDLAPIDSFQIDPVHWGRATRFDRHYRHRFNKVAKVLVQLKTRQPVGRPMAHKIAFLKKRAALLNKSVEAVLFTSSMKGGLPIELPETPYESLVLHIAHPFEYLSFEEHNLCAMAKTHLVSNTNDRLATCSPTEYRDAIGSLTATYTGPAVSPVVPPAPVPVITPPPTPEVEEDPLDYLIGMLPMDIKLEWFGPAIVRLSVSDKAEFVECGDKHSQLKLAEHGDPNCDFDRIEELSLRHLSSSTQLRISHDLGPAPDDLELVVYKDGRKQPVVVSLDQLFNETCTETAHAYSIALGSLLLNERLTRNNHSRFATRRPCAGNSYY